MVRLASSLVLVCLAGQANADEPRQRVWMDQGWSTPSAQTSEQTWYTISQGSRLIRLDWFYGLQDAGAPFAGAALATDYGYPYWDDTARLPIGFVPDVDEQGTEWLGLNCSACHTSRLTYGNAEVMIHGGQSYGDFRSFLGDLTKYLKRVYDNDAKAEAFYQALPNHGNYADVAAMRAEMGAWLAHRAGIDRVQDGLNRDQEWGYGRADAVAYIQAATASVVETKSPDFVSPANAPVNYPPAWNANQQGALQHNGLVANGVDLSILDNNVKLGAYIRNWTEALGVFAQASMDADGNLTTSVKGPNLLKIEKALATLQSPVWPEEIFGAIDPVEAAKGATLYAENCVSCHAVIADPTDLTVLYPLDPRTCSDSGSSFDGTPFVCVQPVVDFTVTRAALDAGMAPSEDLAGTDPMMTCNIMMHRIATGKLRGMQMKNTFKSLSALSRFGEIAYTNQIMATLIIKDLGNQLPDLLQAQLASETDILLGMVKSWFGIDALTGGLMGADVDYGDVRARLAECAQGALALNSMDPKNFPLPGYKSRPLNGIWATPPYLHNGSVPSLYDLLLPPQDRPHDFKIAVGAYDPINVGLAQDQGGFTYRVVSEDGVAIVGNSNLGHEYGTTLSEEDRRDLVAYLKGL